MTTYALTYNWDGNPTASWIGSDDYQAIMGHLTRLTGNPRVTNLVYAETRKTVLS